MQREGINVKKMSPNTMMIVNLISPDGRYDDIFLSNYATIQIRDELGRLPGVADVTYLGQRDYSMRAWLDPDKLASLEPDAPTTWSTAISEQNVQVAAGQIGQQPVPTGQQFQLTINTLGRLDRRRSSSPTSSSRSDQRQQRLGRSATATSQPAVGRGRADDVAPDVELGLAAAVRPVLHARRPAVGGPVDLPAARLQRPGNGPAASTPRWRS